jgi:hypothetical protein
MKPGRLRLSWKKTGQDKGWLYNYPTSKTDGRLLHAMVSGHMLWSQFEEELRKRGYDVTTLRMSVDLKSDELSAAEQRRANQEVSYREERSLRSYAIDQNGEVKP